MSVVIGLALWFGSCVAYKMHSCSTLTAFVFDPKTCKKLLYGALCLMAISLFAISGDVHSWKSSGAGFQSNNIPAAANSEELFDINLSKKAVTVALFCILMVIYSAGVRPLLTAMADRFVADERILIHKTISTSLHWVTLAILIHVILLNWSHIGFGWILVWYASVCLMTITFIAVFIPDVINGATPEGDALPELAEETVEADEEV